MPSLSQLMEQGDQQEPQKGKSTGKLSDLMAGGVDETPEAPAQPGLVRRMGEALLEGVPGIGPAQRAYRQGLTPQEERGAGEVAGVGAALSAPIMGTAAEEKAGKFTPTADTRAEFEAEKAGGPVAGKFPIEPFHVRKQRILDSINSHPLYRAAIAAGIDIPIQTFEFGFANIMSNLFLRSTIKTAQMKAAYAVANPSLEEALSAGREAGQMIATRKVAAQGAAGAAYGAIDVTRRGLSGEPLPVSAYVESPLFGAALGAGLGILGAKIGDAQAKRMAPVIQELLKKDPYAASQVKGAQDIARAVAKSRKVGLPVAGDAIEKVMTGTATPAQREMVKAAMTENPELFNSDIGAHIMQQIHAARAPELIADPSIPADEPVILTYETPTREVRHVALADSKAIAAHKRLIASNQIRVVRASGPEGKMSLLGPAIQGAAGKGPANFHPFTSADADKILSSPVDRVDAHFQGLPNLDVGTEGSLVPTGPVRDVTPGRPAETPYRPGPAYVAARRHGQPMVEVPSELTGETGKQTRSTAGVYAQFADRLVDGPGGLKEKGFVPDDSGTATFSHEHTWLDTKSNGPEVPVSIPGTNDKLLLTPTTLDDPVKARTEPDNPEYQSHKVKVSPETQNTILSTSNPSGVVPAERAFPASPSLMDSLEKAPSSGDLDAWVTSRTKAGKGQRGVKWWNELVGQASKISPDDPRLTPNSARSVMVVLDTHLEDLGRRIAAGKLDIDDPETLRLDQQLNRFKQLWVDRIVPEHRMDVGERMKRLLAEGETAERRATYAHFFETPIHPIRESMQDTDGTILHAVSARDGTVSVVRGELSGTATRVKETGSAGELARPLSTEEAASANTSTALKPLEFHPPKVLQMGLDAVEKVLKFLPDDPGDPRVSKALRQKALLTEALRKRVGTPTEPHVAPIETTVPPDVAAELQRLKTEQAGLKKALKGFKKGALGGGPLWRELPADHDLSGFAHSLGHGRVYAGPGGQIMAELKIGGRTVPMKYPDHFSAIAGMSSIVNESAAVASMDADIERAIQTDTVPPMAIPSQDPISSFLAAYNRPIDYGQNLKTGPYTTAADMDITPGALSDGQSRLFSYGAPGQELVMDLQKYHDGYQQLEGMAANAKKEWKRTGGQKSVREFESGKGNVAGTDKTLRQHLRTQYALGQQVESDIAPFIEDQPGNLFFNHVMPIAEIVKRKGFKFTPEFADMMVDAGIADTRDDALAKFIDSGGFAGIDRERMVQEMVARRNVRLRAEGKPPISVTEAERDLVDFQAKGAAIAPNLQYERQGNPYYDDNMERTFDLVSRRNSRMIMDRVTFGHNMEGLNSKLDRIRTQFGRDAAQFALEMVDHARGRVKNRDSDIAAGSDLLLQASRTYLSMSFLRHIPQTSFIAARFGVGRWLKGWAKVVEDLSTPEGRRAFQQFAMIHRRVDTYFAGGSEEQLEQALGRPGKVGATTRVAAKLGDIASAPLEHSLNFMRRHGYEVGKEYFNDMIEKVKRGDAGALKDLNEHMGPHARGAAQWSSLRGSELEQLRNVSGQRAANWAFFEFNELSLPSGALNNPLARLFFQFKNFLYPYTRLISHELTVGFKKGATSREMARSARMILALGAFAPAYGYGHSKLLQILGAGNKSTKSVVQKVGKAYRTDPSFTRWMDAYAAALSENHALGLFQGFEDAMYTGNEQGMLSTLGGDIPALSWMGDSIMGLNSIGRGAANWAEGKKALGRYQVLKGTYQASRLFAGAGPAALRVLGVPQPKKPKKVRIP